MKNTQLYRNANESETSAFRTQCHWLILIAHRRPH